LVREIADQGFPWVRLLYLHPDRVDADLLKGLRAIPAVIPYLDIPFQHIDSRILALMGREGGEKKIRRLIEEVRSLWPEVALRTSLIAGFPSETEEEFQRLIAFVEETRFDRLALFPYYREEGTVAAELNGQLSVEEKDRRYEELWQLQEKIYQEMSESMVGRTVQVLVDRQDKEDPAVLLCRSTRDAPEIDAYVRVRGSAKPGDFLTVRITKGLVYDVIGEILKEA
jgi:ribosomal protein S12 methylthiotransferase